MADGADRLDPIRLELLYQLTGVAGRLGPANDFWMIKLWEAVQYLHQVGRAELGSSTRGLDLLR